jgi:hypothetical protein
VKDPQPAAEDPGGRMEDGTPTAPLRSGRKRGTAERTVQVSLRLPASWVALLRQRALAAASVEDAMITPQDIVRRMIAEALKPDP